MVKSVSEWYTFVKSRIIKLDNDRSGCAIAPTSSSSSSSCGSDQDREVDQDTARMIRLKKLTRLTHLLVADIRSSSQQFRQIFRDSLNIDYVELLVR